MYSEFVENFKDSYDWAKDKKKEKKLSMLLDFDLEQAQKIRDMESPWEMLEREAKNAMSDLQVASDPSLAGGEYAIGTTDFDREQIPSRMLTGTKPDLRNQVIESRQANRAAIEGYGSQGSGITVPNFQELQPTYWDRLKSANNYADGGGVKPLTEEERRRRSQNIPYGVPQPPGPERHGWLGAISGGESAQLQQDRAARLERQQRGISEPPAAPPEEKHPWLSSATRPGWARYMNQPAPAAALPTKSAEPAVAGSPGSPVNPRRYTAAGTKSKPAAAAAAAIPAAESAAPSTEDVPMFTPARDFPGDVTRMPKISTKVWSDYRKQVFDIAKTGGRMADVMAVDKYVTNMQHEGFMNYAQEARALLAAGDMEGAKKAIHMAYQYFPNGTQAEFAVHKGQLVAVALDEDTGEPVGMQAITPKWLDGVIMNFKDPNNFAQHTVDVRAQDLKEKEFSEYRLPLGQAQSTALLAGARADLNNSVARLEGALPDGSGGTVSQQQAASKALSAMNEQYLMQLAPAADDPTLGRKLLTMQMTMLQMNPQLVSQPQLAAMAGQAIMDFALGVTQQPGFRAGEAGGKYYVQLDNSGVNIEIPKQVYDVIPKGP